MIAGVTGLFCLASSVATFYICSLMLLLLATTILCDSFLDCLARLGDSGIASSFLAVCGGPRSPESLFCSSLLKSVRDDMQGVSKS